MAQPRKLGRVLNHAVSYALLGTLAGCGGQAGLEPAEVAADSGDVTSTPELPAPMDPTGPGAVGTDSNSPAQTTDQPLSTPPGPPSVPTNNEPSLQALVCAGIPMFQSMELTASYDFIALRRLNANGLTAREEVQALGAPCANASNEAACRAALDAAWPEAKGAWTTCGQIGCINNAVVLTHGDVVQLIDTYAGLHALLGTIDNEHEAALWAAASGYTPRCAETLFARLDDRSVRLQTQEMISDCPITMATVTFDVHSAGEFTEQKRDVGAQTGACVGRRSPTLVTLEPGAGSRAAGAFFADISALEASAVEAFRQMAAELSAFGAPDELVRAALDAAGDELRHAAITGELARRHGSEPARATFEAKPLRELFAFALDNVIEGCVRETYGAACARYQARRAAEPAVRAALARIADDEQRHAELSWRINDWLAPRLSDGEQATLALAAERALAELRREVARDLPPDVQQHAGMPSAARAQALLDALADSLWSAPRAA
jgi:hypothetical protein